MNFADHRGLASKSGAVGRHCDALGSPWTYTPDDSMQAPEEPLRLGSICRGLGASGGSDGVSLLSRANRNVKFLAGFWEWLQVGHALSESAVHER